MGTDNLVDHFLRIDSGNKMMIYETGTSTLERDNPKYVLLSEKAST